VVTGQFLRSDSREDPVSARCADLRPLHTADADATHATRQSRRRCALGISSACTTLHRHTSPSRYTTGCWCIVDARRRLRSADYFLLVGKLGISHFPSAYEHKNHFITSFRADTLKKHTH